MTMALMCLANAHKLSKRRAARSRLTKRNDDGVPGERRSTRGVEAEEEEKEKEVEGGCRTRGEAKG